ncbi:hypothetical protein [Cellvibrio mixtus]|uniref:hypothetical protein n=1 Tax=Cellvibrio mixtus TaxID=39650 RepID=UPI00058805EA|nr:hypothetical protein [Cellvibrio mixtus]
MSVVRMPWERRLDDLAHILHACSETYFDPELFRRNTNQFLQTARTITFIIQKNKSDIQNFDEWYQENVLDKWVGDDVMRWAKDSRNIIEKQGDLEFNSTLTVTLIFSYLEEDDLQMPVGEKELLTASVKRLVRFAQKYFPTRLTDVAGVKIERAWVTKSLEKREILSALEYVYARQYDCCEALAKHLNREFYGNVHEQYSLGNKNEYFRQVEMIKLKSMQSCRISFGQIKRPPSSQVPDFVRGRASELKSMLGEAPHDYKSAVDYYSRMAEGTFKQWGNHLTVLYFLNPDWSIQQMINPMLIDQTDKYFFARLIAEQIKVKKPHCLIHITEAWTRDLKKYRPGLTMSKLPINGEFLQLAAVDVDGNKTICTWRIVRELGDQIPMLDAQKIEDETDERIFFLVPAMRAMGVQPKFYQSD